MFLRALMCLLLVVTCPVLPAWAVDLTPFTVRNLSPAALVHGLAVAEPARLTPPGRLSARLGFDIISNATLSDSANESILFDGESYVTTFGLRYGIAERLQIGLDLPWVAHTKGSFDSFVEDWHKFFGLPNGDRSHLPDDELTYAYANASGDQLLLDDESSGVGDARLLVAWQLLANQQSAASLFTSIKAPTGDADDLTGSGAWDVSIGLSAQRDFPLAQGYASVWGGLGGSWLGDGDVLENQAEDWAASVWAGAGWSPLDWLGLKLQLDSHSALYDSALDELGNPPLILTLGGTLGFGERTSLDIGVGEDLAVNASPDVTFHLNLVHKF
ncbi:MAG: DUF3187 family protein [Desulfuromonadales bacterium]|nr:DUF3187 family protein [Desulfuromonadales bacterium]